MRRILAQVLIFLTSFGQCRSFGFVGHYVIGEAVHRTLTDNARTVIQECGLLTPFNNSMGRAAVWADSAKYQKRYSWTRTIHYFDTPGDPPETCGRIVDVGDPGDLNLLSALNNFTRPLQVACPSQLNFNLLLHLLQDLHQPLHLTGKARGGNTVHLVINGRRTTLHGFWDSGAINTFITQRLPVGNRTVKDAIAHFVNLSENTLRTIPLGTAQQVFVDWANEVLFENCRLLWRYNEMTNDEYVEQALTLIEDLIVKAIQRSTYVLERLLTTSSDQDVIQINRLVIQPSYS